VRSVPRCYKQDKSRVYLVVRQSPASKGVNTEAEEATALIAVTRRQPAKIQQTEKMCELAIALFFFLPLAPILEHRAYLSVS
jgi:hypothetical protein